MDTLNILYLWINIYMVEKGTFFSGEEMEEPQKPLGMKMGRDPA